MKKHTLQADALHVESFDTLIAGPGGGCICDYPPCGCTAGPDCTEAC